MFSKDPDMLADQFIGSLNDDWVLYYNDENGNEITEIWKCVNQYQGKYQRYIFKNNVPADWQKWIEDKQEEMWQKENQDELDDETIDKIKKVLDNLSETEKSKLMKQYEETTGKIWEDWEIPFYIINTLNSLGNSSIEAILEKYREEL